MKRTLSILLAGLTLLSLSAGIALAGRGGDKIPLNILWRVSRAGTNDRMDSATWSEIASYTFEGATYYVPAGLVSGTQALYREYYSFDRMPSTVLGEGGYTTEGPIGYPFASAVAGTEPMRRKYNTTTGDHCLGPNWEALSGYTNENPGTAVYGYPRYLNANTSLLSLSAGGVTMSSNIVAGGAVWDWTWNGVQFVNDKDYGRQLQAAVFFKDESNVQCNPTEAGDEWTAQTTYGQRHGSPLISLYNSGNTQSSRCVPLEWLAQDHGGGQYQPVIWKQMILGKDVELNYNGMGPVAKYTTYFYTPTDLPSADIECPTMYLRAEFNYFYTYDAAAKTLKRVYPGTGGADPVLFYVNYGGVIISNPAGTQATACYGVSSSLGGSATLFGLWDFSSQGGTGAILERLHQVGRHVLSRGRHHRRRAPVRQLHLHRHTGPSANIHEYALRPDKTNPNPDGNSDSHSDGNPNRNPDRNPDRDTNSNANGDSDADPDTRQRSRAVDALSVEIRDRLSISARLVLQPDLVLIKDIIETALRVGRQAFCVDARSQVAHEIGAQESALRIGGRPSHPVVPR